MPNSEEKYLTKERMMVQSLDKKRQVIKVISLTSFYATKRKTEFTTKRVSSVFCV